MPRHTSRRKGTGPEDRRPHDTGRTAGSLRLQAGYALHPSGTGRAANAQDQRPAGRRVRWIASLGEQVISWIWLDLPARGAAQAHAGQPLTQP